LLSAAARVVPPGPNATPYTPLLPGSVRVAVIVFVAISHMRVDPPVVVELPLLSTLELPTASVSAPGPNATEKATVEEPGFLRVAASAPVRVVRP